ncbi:neuronal cell adhesion molecule-like isoform X2 [Haliotis asinina]|uniref:neuronal cell adhesion molecule-like isoform X2 n=1 Tax=Haliotis asinina TaxID=109174 RepID=UPI0035318EB4
MDNIQKQYYSLCEVFMEIPRHRMWIIALISCCAKFTDGESIIVRETETARFRWQVPGGTSVTAMYVISPGGTAVLLANILNRHMIAHMYEARVTYTGNMTAGMMAFDMSNVSRSDAGNYTCGQNGLSDIIPNCGQMLIILGKPTKPVISLQSTPVVGRNVTMRCSSTSTTLPADHGLTFTYAWKVDGRNRTSPGGASITLPVESYNPPGVMCHVTEDEGLGRDSDVLVLTPEYPPYNISISAASVQVKETDNVPRVRCDSTCRPTCSYSWKQGSQIVMTGQVLDLGAANRTVAGSYVCTAENIYGTLESLAVALDVLCSPRLNFQYTARRDVYVDVGQPVRLQAHILAFPRPTFTWLKQNGGTDEPIDVSKWRQYDNAMTSYIVTDIAEENDYGTYYVNVTNSLGRFRMQFQLGKKAPLPVPENFQCQNKAGGYILQWTPGDDAETRGVDFVVEQRLPQANWTTVSAPVESDGTLRQVQLPLSGGSTVFFRLYATEDSAMTSPVMASCSTFIAVVPSGELSFGAGVGVGFVVAVVAVAVSLAVVCICRKKRQSTRNDSPRQKEEESVYHEVAASTATVQHRRPQDRQSGEGTSRNTYEALTSDRDTPVEAPSYEQLEKPKLYVNMAVSADDDTERG